MAGLDGSLLVGLNLIDTSQILFYVYTSFLITYNHVTMIFLCSLILQSSLALLSTCFSVLPAG